VGRGIETLLNFSCVERETERMNPSTALPSEAARVSGLWMHKIVPKLE